MKDNAMLSRLFFKLLPVQVLIVAMSAVNSIVDGAVAGRCIDAETVGVVGLYFSVVRVLSAVEAVMLGGTAVLCGRSMGSGDLEKTNRIFTVNMKATLAVGAVITALSFAVPGTVADILGTSAELKPALITYIRGYAVGIVPLLLAQQLAAFLQMERQSGRGYAGIAGMILSNIALDILLVPVLGLGVRGLALATAFSNWVYFLILAPYYFGGRSQIRMERSRPDPKLLASILVIGMPGAVLTFTLAVRAVVINRILLTYSGTAGLSAQAAFNMITGLFIAFALGTGATLRMLASIFIGEEDRSSLRQLLRIALTKAMPLSLVIAVIVLLVSDPISGLFFPERGSEAFALARQLFIIYSFCIPPVVLCQIVANYLQATGHHLYIDLLSVIDGFFSMVIPAWILAPRLGALGVWLANPIGIVITLLFSLGYICAKNGRFPRTEDEWMLLDADFGVPEEDRLDIAIHGIEDVTNTAEQVQRFCSARGLDAKTSYYAALCLEEMAGNVVAHGFRGDSKKHMAEAHVVYKDGSIMLRIKDDCVPFDPVEMEKTFSPDDPMKNIGIRMVDRIAKETEYQNLMGLNVLTICL